MLLLTQDTSRLLKNGIERLLFFSFDRFWNTDLLLAGRFRAAEGPSSSAAAFTDTPASTYPAATVAASRFLIRTRL